MRTGLSLPGATSLILCLAVCWPLYAVGPPGDYICQREIHLAPEGRGSNPGTPGQPRSDIHAAARSAVAGDCLLLHRGTYLVGKPISFNNNGTAESPIVLASNDGPLAAVIDASDHRHGRTLSIQNDYVIVDGLDFINKPVGSREQVVYFGSGSPGSGKGSVLRNCRITGGHNHLKINGMPAGIVIERCEFYGRFGHIPISITGAADVVFRHNYLHDFDSGGNGSLQIKGGSRRVLVEGNLFEDIRGNGGAVALGDGCSTSCDNDPDHFAGRQLAAVNNLMVRVGRGFDIYGCLDCVVLNNTVFDSAKSTVAFKVGPATTGGAKRHTRGLRFYNNILTNPGADLFAVMQVKQGSAEGFSAGANLLWNGNRMVRMGSAPAVLVETARVKDPLLLSPQTGNYTPAPGSPALDSGHHLKEVTQDRTGRLRPGGRGYDIGSEEAPAAD